MFYSNTIALKHITPVNAALFIVQKHYNKHAEFTRYWKEVQLTIDNRINAKQWHNIRNLMKAYESATIAAKSKELSFVNKVPAKKNELKRTRSQSNKPEDSRSLAPADVQPNKSKKIDAQTSAIYELRSSQKKNGYNLRQKM